LNMLEHSCERVGLIGVCIVVLIQVTEY